MYDYIATISFHGNSLTLTLNTDFSILCVVYPADKTAHTGLKTGTIRTWEIYLNQQRMHSTTNATKRMSNCQIEGWIGLWKTHGENWRIFSCGGQVKIQPHVLSRQTWSCPTDKNLKNLASARRSGAFQTWGALGRHGTAWAPCGGAHVSGCAPDHHLLTWLYLMTDDPFILSINYFAWWHFHLTACTHSGG